MNRKIITTASDAPPVTSKTLREMADRIYMLENALASSQTGNTATDKGLSASLQSLSLQVADLNSRYAVHVNGDFSIATGEIPTDGVWREYGSEMELYIDSPGPHKQVVISIGAARAAVTTGTSSAAVAAEVTYRFDSYGYGTDVARVYTNAGVDITVTPFTTRSYRLAAGTYRVRAICRAWCSGTGPGNTASFTSPYLTAEVIGSRSTGLTDEV